MISLADFAKANNISQENVRSGLKDGTYTGLYVDGIWYLSKFAGPKKQKILNRLFASILVRSLLLIPAFLVVVELGPKITEFGRSLQTQFGPFSFLLLVVPFFAIFVTQRISRWIMRPYGRSVQNLLQYTSPSAEEARAIDPRPPIILLRAFREDERLIEIGILYFAESSLRYEELIVSELRKFGPPVAIGRPGESLPALGAARWYTDDLTWKQSVKHVIEVAQIIVLVAGESEGLLWELRHVLKNGLEKKLLVCFPPVRDRHHRETRLDQLRKIFHEYTKGRLIIPPLEGSDRLLYLTFDAEGNALGHIGPPISATFFGIGVRRQLRKAIRSITDRPSETKRTVRQTVRQFIAILPALLIVSLLVMYQYGTWDWNRLLLTLDARSTPTEPLVFWLRVGRRLDCLGYTEEMYSQYFSHDENTSTDFAAERAKKQELHDSYGDTEFFQQLQQQECQYWSEETYRQRWSTPMIQPGTYVVCYKLTSGFNVNHLGYLITRTDEGLKIRSLENHDPGKAICPRE